MQYSICFPYSFVRSKPTLRAVDPLEQHLVGRRIGRMTHRDMAGFNTAYQCSDHCADPPACQNEGYVDKTCRCVCPDGITGELCETKPDDYRYYGPLCGDVNITTAGTINYELERTYKPTKHCFWLVTAPEGQEVSLTFGDVCMNEWPRCSRDVMRIALEGDLRDSAVSGCGQEFSSTQHVSVGGRMLVHLRTKGGSRCARTFSAEVAFAPAE